MSNLATPTTQWNLSLPYMTSTLLSQESQDFFQEIIQGLRTNLSAGDYTACLIYLKQVNNYLDLKYPLTEQQRVELIKLTFDAITLSAKDPQIVTEVSVAMEPNMIEAFCTICNTLLKKEHTPKDLTLPWRPLWNLIKYYNMPKLRQRLVSLPAQNSVNNSLRTLVERSKRFFSPEAPQEILQEFLPIFTPHASANSSAVLGLLAAFLPSNRVPTPISPNGPAFYWLPTLIELAQQTPNLADGVLLSVFQRLARENYQHPERIGWDNDMLDLIMNMIIRGMDVPVGTGVKRQRNMGNFEGNSLQQLMAAVSDFMGKTRPDMAKCSAQTLIYLPNGLYRLQRLLTTLNSYFHPSNHGRWSNTLASFLHNLAYHFTDRLNRESKDPHPSQLTKDDQVAFVNMMLPPTLLCVYSKDATVCYHAQGTLKFLAWLEPDLVLEPLLDRVQDDLLHLDAAHRTTATLSVLCSVMQPMLKRSHFSGGKHLGALLEVILPCLDVNDPSKSWVMLALTHIVFGLVPMVECVDVEMMDVSEVSSETDEDWTVVKKSNQRQLWNAREDDDEVRMVTTYFEPWCLLFFDRIFAFLDHVGDQKIQGVEANVLEMIMSSLDRLFCSVSDDIQSKLVRKLKSWLEEKSRVNLARFISQIVGCTTGSNPRHTLTLFDVAKNHILEELEHGAGQKDSRDEVLPSDARLITWLAVAQGSLTNGGKEILPYISSIKTLIETLYDPSKPLKSRHARGWSSRIVSTLLQALTETYPWELRTLQPQEWKKHSQEHYKAWVDDQLPKSQAQAEWHQPDQEECQIALEFAENLTKLAVQELKKLMITRQKKDEGDVLRWLGLLEACFKGTRTLAPPQPSSVQELDDVFSAPLPKRQIAAGFANYQVERVYQLRTTIIDSLLVVADTLMDHMEDATDATKKCIDILNVIVCEPCIDRGVADGLLRNYDTIKKNIVGVKHSDLPRLPRYLLVRRVWALHMARLKFDGQNSMWTPRHDEIFNRFLKFSFTRYVDVRRHAQHALSQGVKLFSFARVPILHKILDALTPPSLPPSDAHVEKLKGALHLLDSQTFRRVCMRDPKIMRRFQTTLVQTHHVDRPHVQEITRKVFVEYLISFSRIRLDPLAGLPGLTVNVEEVQKAQDRMNRRFEMANQEYSLMIDELIKLARSLPHWRYQSMALNFLDVDQRPERPISLELTKLFLENCVSEMPSIRRIAITATNRTFTYLKHRANTCGQSVSKLIKRRDIPTAQFMQDLNKNDRLVDVLSCGVFCWPQKVASYAWGPDLNGQMPYVDPESLETIQLIQSTLSSPEYWRKFLGYTSQEALARGNEAAIEVFDHTVAAWYKFVFQLFQDSFIEPAKLPELIASMTEMILEKPKQRASAELLTGLIRGSKHWSPRQLENLWSWVLSLLTKAMDQASPESWGQWEILLRAVSMRRDPRRIEPLLQFVLSKKLDPNSSSFFTETKKLLMLKTLLVVYGHRIRDQTLPLVQELLADFGNPYQQVREVLGGVWNELLQVQSFHGLQGDALQVLHRDLELWNKAGLERLDLGVQTSLDPSLQSSVDKLVEMLKDTNVDKTTTSWLIEALSGNRIQASYPILIRLTPLILEMTDSSDQDLQAASNQVLSMIAQLSLPPTLAKEMLQVLLNLLPTSNWHRQLRILPMIQVLYFNHLFTINQQLSSQIVMAVGNLLNDSQVEVRELAATTLSGLIRCSHDLVPQLLQHFETMLRQNKGKKDIVKRHAAVLGLSALIQAFPYDVPEWMPKTLATLASCANDSGVIATTTKKTFADFKRTHQDTWHQDKEKFTPDELESIADVFSGGNYYV